MSTKSKKNHWRHVAWVSGSALAGYLLLAYVLLPAGWKLAYRGGIDTGSLPRTTTTGAGIPGDPLNVALAGIERDVKSAMLAAGWFPADPLTFKSCLEIAEASVLKRPYEDAPVSNLFLFGRKEDLAFEKPVGDSPRKRHHVRFWQSEILDSDSRPIWLGSATFDERVGLSRTTGQITHVTAPDVDAERKTLFEDLQNSGTLTDSFFVDGFHRQLSGKNGGGDPWRTDGRLEVGRLRTAGASSK